MSEGISTYPDKVEAVLNYLCPKNVKDIRAFLGLASFYRRFVPRLAEIAKPLSELTRKDGGVSDFQGYVKVSVRQSASHQSNENILYVMFNVRELTASHHTDRMSANPIRILAKATFAIPTMRADDVTRKSEKENAGTRVGRAIRDLEYIRW